ncbi:transcriptional regulator [Caproiciproducens galactitolivorans]|uniref:2,3-diketo-5-methylthiopentyl-1-phosphate enolase n=1 Tax=Caproiciproducens galactitolivorans TaxID=642589 RepID=A0A4Z0YFS6_9FIRM|nr:RuBisCO large subunit C-terminal-like domain-containing protein [Caproiciproducens galactitolivorans]QEY34730.1 transcriptional regulator [Caproiciproducens galactitolivorans]TGJ75792.1 2,3-diketo-5-methylthiopentyl-1-phosphate enolase [Caproiciproducens galactitolivorans]
MKQTQLYALNESIRSLDYVLATYYIELPKETNVVEKAVGMTIGQTLGTWVPVPGITDEMRDKHMGKVINIIDLPPCDLSTQVQTDTVSYLIQLAYPTANFSAQFPQMLVTVLGNDASTSAQVKLVDIQFPESFVKEFQGPNFGIEGIRKFTGVAERPLLLNMIKPCTGFTPDIGAKIFYETALGGVDFIKDDELLGNPDFCPVEQRVKAYQKASDAAFEKTGHRTVYICNITDRADRMIDNAKRCIDAGAKAIMVSYAAVGYSMVCALAQSVNVPILGHYASSGMFYEGIVSGFSAPFATGLFPRMAGADMIMMNTPYGGYPLKFQKYIQTAHKMSLPYYHLKPSMPIVGGGVHPGITERYVKDLGSDIIFAAGGSVQGHPMGAAAGARAMRQAIDAVMSGIPLKDAAKEHEELRVALERFGLHN